MVVPVPPRAPIRPHQLVAHGHTRTDNWYWLMDRDDPAVLEYLQAENAYADEVLAPTAGLQDELFEQIRHRVQETDAGAPMRSGGWWYYTRTAEGLQYPIRCRRPDTGQPAVEVADANRAGVPDDELVLLDDNELAAGEYLAIGVFDVRPDHRAFAYATDFDGSELYTLRFKAIGVNGTSDMDDVVEGVYYGSAWASDGSHFFYVRPDEAMRPWQVWRHEMGTPADADVVVHEEPDEHFFVAVGLSRDEKKIMIVSDSKTSSEVRWLPSEGPWDRAPQVVLGRRPAVEYQAEPDGDDWLIVTNEPGPGGEPHRNFELQRIRPEGPAEVLIAHRDDTKIDGVDGFARFTVVSERSATDGLERLRVIERDGTSHLIEQPEAAYMLIGGANAEWDQESYRFGYTSLVAPRTWIDYDVAARKRQEVWTQLVPGYQRDRFVTERLWADAPDGTRIPVTLVAPRDVPTDGTAAGLLYGYGAYEASMDPAFSALTINLLERGMVFAIAHVRGGGELGRAWYEQGRMEHKANTFSDFIAAAEALIATGRVSRSRLAARGGSAGGLLMGAVTNLRPDLWRAVVAEVPFVDVVTTMSDPSLPLTVTEWEEWGNPLEDAGAYRWMLDYSPYDNVAATPPWPAIYATAGLNDPRVGFWEPAKWVAKLRSLGAGAGDRPVLLRTELGAGHGGPSGRYDVWRDEARVQAFVLTQLRA
jgi:oligopeptidase B